MDFIDPQLAHYAEQHSSPESEALFNLNRSTNLKTVLPRMLSGHLQGRFLSMFSHALKPALILEIGTFTGYSALCLAEGLAPGGKLITLEIDPEMEPFFKPHFDASPYADNISYHIGDAIEWLKNNKISPDLVFIDADKENYLNYYKMVLPMMPSGGHIIADNVLWSGKVIKLEELKKDMETAAIHQFNEFVTNDPLVENLLLPVRDGLMMIRKL